MADPAFDIIYAGSGASPVSAGGTITFQYAAARGPASYAGQWPALVNVRANQGNYTQDTDFTIVYGPSSIVITWLSIVPIPANTQVYLQVPVRDTSGYPNVNQPYTPSGIAVAADYNSI